MAFLIISASLNPSSHSRILAKRALSIFELNNTEYRMIDLRDYGLPFCDGDESYNHAQVPKLKQMIREAEAVLIATPIYNYDANAQIKNLIELTGKSWENKVVGFMCAAGAKSSYMSIMSLANSLMLDFRCFILPRFVFAVSGDFKNKQLVNEQIDRRLHQLVELMIKMHAALDTQNLLKTV
ncbi:MAG: NADPH-dependent oxidoreductase [Caldithrix sp.]|nr:NADPH-dependent oxidoreductase [Caldithrix sp.]